MRQTSNQTSEISHKTPFNVHFRSLRFLFIASCSFLILMLAILTGVELQKPCHDRLPITACRPVIDFGFCAASPSLAQKLCGETCGWCTTGPEAERLPIKRVHARDVTDRHIQEHKEKNVPLIIEGFVDFTGMEPLNTKLLRKHCGERKVKFTNRRVQFLKEFGHMLGDGLPRRFVEKLLGTSITMLIQKAETPVTLNTLIDAYEAQFKIPNKSQPSYSSMLDYFIHASDSYPDLNDETLWHVCPDVIPMLKLPSWAVSRTLSFKSPCHEDIRMQPVIFIEAGSSRPYPSHEHGIADLTQGFQLVTQGAKRVVLWPIEEKEKLYPLGSAFTTEAMDVIYMAEGINHRHDMFPATRTAMAWEGELQEGELLLIPREGVHVFESVGISVGVRFMYHDEISVQKAANVIKANPGGFKRQVLNHYLHYIARLIPVQVEEPPATVIELAEQLGCGSDFMFKLNEE